MFLFSIDFSLLSQLINFILQALKELGSLTTIHLDMMELERYGQSGFEPPLTIPGPS
jgi:hypothetical protein